MVVGAPTPRPATSPSRHPTMVSVPHRRPSPFPIAGLALAALLLLAPGARGQADAGRTLHWRSIDVRARLDAQGRLHVRERQAMVFDGAWNGGERRFRLRLGQQLKLDDLSLEDSTGRLHPLQAGDLDEVGHYDWGDGHALRWRSRRPGILPSTTPSASTSWSTPSPTSCCTTGTATV